jgi:hypothetical protein
MFRLNHRWIRGGMCLGLVVASCAHAQVLPPDSASFPLELKQVRDVGVFSQMYPKADDREHIAWTYQGPPGLPFCVAFASTRALIVEHAFTCATTNAQGSATVWVGLRVGAGAPALTGLILGSALVTDHRSQTRMFRLASSNPR